MYDRQHGLESNLFLAPGEGGEPEASRGGRRGCGARRPRGAGSSTRERAAPFQDAVVLAPLTVGGNLPFRRLCVELGARVTFGEMAVVRKLLRGSSSRVRAAEEPSRRAVLRRPARRQQAREPGRGARLAESRGARFVDLNCGCPIHEITRRGLGASLLRKPSRLGRLVGGDGEGGARSRSP